MNAMSAPVALQDWVPISEKHVEPWGLYLAEDQQERSIQMKKK